MSDGQQDIETPEERRRINEAMEMLNSTPMMFWICPIESHQDRSPSVEWEGNVAFCLAYRCMHSSAGLRIAGTRQVKSDEWPADIFIQGGRQGVVIRRNPGDKDPTYLTAFVECHDEEGGFIRGEGEAVADAEADALAKYKKHAGCATKASTGEHDWEARGYTNGGGFCTDCNRFGSQVFTAKDLGLTCHACGTDTNWSKVGDFFLCPDHTVPCYSVVNTAKGYRDEPDHGGWSPEDMEPHLSRMGLEALASFGDSHLPTGITWEAAGFNDRWDAVITAAVELAEQRYDDFTEGNL